MTENVIENEVEKLLHIIVSTPQDNPEHLKTMCEQLMKEGYKFAIRMNKHGEYFVTRPPTEGDEDLPLYDVADMRDISEKIAWISEESKKVLANIPLRVKQNSNDKLSEQQVREMREYYDNNEITYVALGKMYGISGRHVSDIINRKYWTHI